jgi:hypothetical protein
MKRTLSCIILFALAVSIMPTFEIHVFANHQGAFAESGLIETEVFAQLPQAEDEPDAFTDPGMNLSNSDIIRLFQCGYTPYDIEKAMELSTKYDKTPCGILQTKGTEKHDVADESEQGLSIAETTEDLQRLLSTADDLHIADAPDVSDEPESLPAIYSYEKSWDDVELEISGYTPTEIENDKLFTFL